jgi:hypothetical protein
MSRRVIARITDRGIVSGMRGCIGGATGKKIGSGSGGERKVKGATIFCGAFFFSVIF